MASVISPSGLLRCMLQGDSIYTYIRGILVNMLLTDWKNNCNGHPILQDLPRYNFPSVVYRMHFQCP